MKKIKKPMIIFGLIAIIVVLTVLALVGNTLSEGQVEDEEVGYEFTLEQVGDSLKAGSLKQEDLEHTDMKLYGKVESVSDNGIEIGVSRGLTGGLTGVTAEVSYTDNLFNGKEPRGLAVGQLVCVDGMLDTIEVECKDSEVQSVIDSLEETTERIIESESESTTYGAVGVDRTKRRAELESEATGLGIDLSSIKAEDAPVTKLIQSKYIELGYRLTVCYVRSISEVTGEEYNALEPKLDGIVYQPREYLTDEELEVYAIEQAIYDKKNEAKTIEERAEQAERDRLNSLSEADLASYIKQGSGGVTSAEPDISKYEATPKQYFRLEGNKVLGLTDGGKQLKTIIVPGDLLVDSDSELWDDLKKANTVEFLGFKGTYFTATKVMTEESPSEKAKREGKGLPAPYTYDYKSSFSIKSGALEGCSSIKVLVLPYGVNTIGSRAFSNCSELNYVKMPERVFSLQGNIFNGSSKIVSLIMPSQIIENWSTECLYGMSGLENLIFASNTAPSAGVLDEDMYIFKGCTSLERVVLSPTVQFNRSLLENSYKGLDGVNLQFSTVK